MAPARIGAIQRLYRAAGQPKRLEILAIAHYEIDDLPHHATAVILAIEWFRTLLGPAAGHAGA